MSLNWNLKNVKNHDSVCFSKDEKGRERMECLTEVLITMTMSVDLGEISEKNYKEFFIRIDMLQRGLGGLMNKVVAGKNGGDDLETIWITLEDIRKHIGLTTNVSDKSSAAFSKRFAERMRRQSEDKVRYEDQKVGEKIEKDLAVACA
ncbi:MAG: hypothetical protein PHV42_04525 [Candidatus Pacebacteria bacterium]|nr:hypothetical protein [Candidatus Paceibacterota bacterium]